MYPMITSEEELDEIEKLIQEVKKKAWMRRIFPTKISVPES